MKIVNRYKSCVGITLWKWNWFKVEVWYCPSRFAIVPHSHNNEDIELTFLFGEAMFHRQRVGHQVENAWVSFCNIGKTFSIPAGTLHWFEVSNWPLIFINRERWLCEPTSASIDFHPAKTEE